MLFIIPPPLAGGLASIALAARPSGLGTIIVAAIAIVFVGLIVVGSRPSVMTRYRDADDADAPGSAADPPASGGRR